MEKQAKFWVSALHVYTLLAFCAVQPLLDVLGRNATFFTAHRAGATEILAMVVVLAIGLPSVLVVVEIAVRIFNRKGYRVLHFALVGVLVWLTALLPLKRASAVVFSRNGGGMLRWAADVAILAVATAIAFLAARAYARGGRVRTFLTWLSPVIIVFPLLFLFISPASRLMVFKSPRFKAVPVGADSAADKLAPVVMIVFDELNGMSLLDEKHQIDAARYPRLAEFAGQATWFRNATTNGYLTEFAVPAMLTGKYPDRALDPNMADHPQNLFSLLASTHQLQVDEAVTDLCRDIAQPLDIRARILSQMMVDAGVIYGQVVAPHAVSQFLPGVGGRWGGFVDIGPGEKEKAADPIRDHGVAGTFRTFVDGIRPTRGLTLYYHHSMLPHVPYQYLPSGRPYALHGAFEEDMVGLDPPMVTWRDDEWAVLQNEQRYLLQLGFVDRLVGELVDKLKEVGLYDRSLIVLASDHGVSFHAGESRRDVSNATWQDILPVMLIVKAPFQTQGIISDHNVELIDVLPTITDVLGITVPWATDGNSAIDESTPPRAQKRVMGEKDWYLFDGELRDRYKSVDWMLQNFSSDADPSGLYKVGPNSFLVGRSVSDFEAAGPSETQVRLDRPAEIGAPDRLPLGCWLRGSVNRGAETPARSPVELAIAVNGTVCAVTRTFTLQGLTDVWCAMLPEEALASKNAWLEVFVVQKAEAAAETRLTRAYPR